MNRGSRLWCFYNYSHKKLKIKASHHQSFWHQFPPRSLSTTRPFSGLHLSLNFHAPRYLLRLCAPQQRVAAFLLPVDCICHLRASFQQHFCNRPPVFKLFYTASREPEIYPSKRNFIRVSHLDPQVVAAGDHIVQRRVPVDIFLPYNARICLNQLIQNMLERAQIRYVFTAQFVKQSFLALPSVPAYPARRPWRFETLVKFHRITILARLFKRHRRGRSAIFAGACRFISRVQIHHYHFICSFFRINVVLGHLPTRCPRAERTHHVPTRCFCGDAREDGDKNCKRCYQNFSQ